MSIGGVFSPQEVRTIKVWMEKKFWVRSFIPSFKGKYKLALFFFWLGKVFQPVYNAWGTSDQKLGNLQFLNIFQENKRRGSPGIDVRITDLADLDLKP